VYLDICGAMRYVVNSFVRVFTRHTNARIMVMKNSDIGNEL